MPVLDLTGQAAHAADIQTRIVKLNARLTEREAVFQRLPEAKQRAWVASGRDPILSLAWIVYRRLHRFFDGVNPDDV